MACLTWLSTALGEGQLMARKQIQKSTIQLYDALNKSEKMRTE